jgi:hypothetical protein
MRNESEVVVCRSMSSGVRNAEKSLKSWSGFTMKKNHRVRIVTGQRLKRKYRGSVASVPAHLHAGHPGFREGR